MQMFDVKTNARDEMVDITAQVQAAVDDAMFSHGMAVVFIPHTTAGVTINEHADPAVAEDILYVLDRQVAWSDPRYRHREGNTASHVKASLMGSSANVAVADGRLVLGTWQGVFLCEFDGPRRRRVQVTLLST
jgi:secondary thiamine-phosphate synthase enzyme